MYRRHNELIVENVSESYRGSTPGIEVIVATSELPAVNIPPY
jgi:hypothetical protein